jgi:hypothetical protein
MALLSKEAGIATGSVFGFLLILLFGVVVWLIVVKRGETKTHFTPKGGRRKRLRSSLIKNRR